MLKSSHLGLPDSRVAVTCENVALDPRHPKTIYAGFQASDGGSIPPVYNVALVTTNMGRSWRLVPPPRGDSVIDFGGFVERPSGIDLLYSRNILFPPRADQRAALEAATSSTGGNSWTDVRLGCPAGRPCVIFGPEAPQGACGMSEWKQSVLVGEVGFDSEPRWREAGSISTVSQCGSQQLISSSSGDEFLVDRSRPDALFLTRDGLHWTTVALPKIQGTPVGGKFLYLGQIMTIDAKGALVAVAGTPSAMAEHLEVLEPGSNSWCAANVVLPAATKQNPVAAMQSSKSTLVVAFFTPIPTRSGKKTMAESIPLSSLSCS